MRSPAALGSATSSPRFLFSQGLEPGQELEQRVAGKLRAAATELRLGGARSGPRDAAFRVGDDQAVADDLRSAHRAASESGRALGSGIHAIAASTAVHAKV